jgi:hypothetical protein
MACGYQFNTPPEAIAAVVAAAFAAIGIGCAATAHASSDTAYVRSPWGYRCLLTDYDQNEGAPLATCELPSMGQDLASVGAGGDLKWGTGNIDGVGTDWNASGIHLVVGQSYDLAGGWGLTFTSAGLNIGWDDTGHGILLHPDGTVQSF